MIILRQGKAKTILESSINSAFTAVETYNRPRTQFRIENYIILMIIAWTKLFHAYFQATIGERYFYKEKNGRFKRVDGEKKAWELTECLKNIEKAKQNIKFRNRWKLILNFLLISEIKLNIVIGVHLLWIFCFSENVNLYYTIMRISLLIYSVRTIL